jgi:hypothetical protein
MKKTILIAALLGISTALMAQKPDTTKAQKPNPNYFLAPTDTVISKEDLYYMKTLIQPGAVKVQENQRKYNEAIFQLYKKHNPQPKVVPVDKK